MRHVVQMGLEDAEHYSAEARAAITASYPAYEREARTLGVPTMGSGRVFPVAEADIVCAPFEIPAHWPQIVGLDFGWDHPFAAVCLAWDREADAVYLTREYAARETTPPIHAAALRPWGDWTPCAWPHDGLQHDKGSGQTFAEQYRAQGLALLSERATFVDGGSSVEAGVMEMLTRMQTGRWKVFATLEGWIGEFRLYHRKAGLIVPVRDDRISASRYGLMMLRFAATRPRDEAALAIPDWGVV